MCGELKKWERVTFFGNYKRLHTIRWTLTAQRQRYFLFSCFTNICCKSGRLKGPSFTNICWPLTRHSDATRNFDCSAKWMLFLRCSQTLKNAGWHTQKFHKTLVKAFPTFSLKLIRGHYETLIRTIGQQFQRFTNVSLRNLQNLYDFQIGRNFVPTATQ